MTRTILDKTPKGKKKPRQPTDNMAMDQAQHGGEHDEDGEEEELELAKVLDLMTNKLMMAITDKLEPLAKTLLSLILTSWRELMTAWMKQRLGCYILRPLPRRKLIEQKPWKEIQSPPQPYRRSGKQRGWENVSILKPAREYVGEKCFGLLWTLTTGFSRHGC